MKFDVLIKELLNEAIQDHGKFSSEESLAKAKVDGIEIFERTHDPRELRYIINNPYIEINFEGKKISGNEIKQKIKSIFFTKGSKNFINIPRFEEGFGGNQKIPDQEDILRTAKVLSREGKLKEDYPEFSKTAGLYKDWRGLLLDLASEEEVTSAVPRNISQKGGGQLFMDYINVNNQPRNTFFNITDPVYNESGKIVDGKITVTPFGGKGEGRSGKPIKNTYSDPDVRPLSLKNVPYETLLSNLNGMGGNFKSILTLCDGKQGTQNRYKEGKIAKRPSLIELMRQGKA